MDSQLQKLLCNTFKHGIQMLQVYYTTQLYFAYCKRVFYYLTIYSSPLQGLSTFVDCMLQADDPDGFVDRQLFDFPPEKDVYVDDLKVPIIQDVP